MRLFSIKTCIAVFLLFFTIGSFAQITMLSGVEGGSYEQFANDIKNITEKNSIEIKTSTGSVDNFRQLTQERKIDVTFLQEDVLFHRQLKDLEDGTNYVDDIRVLLPLGYEEIHLIARADADIHSLKDLKGKDVAIGSETQGTHITAKMVKELTNGKWKEITETLVFDSVFSALLNKKIDAFFFVGAAPVSKLTKLPPQANVKLVPLNDDRLAEYYTQRTIEAGTYKCAPEDVVTYAVKSLLVTDVHSESKSRKKKLLGLVSDIKNNIDKLKENGHRKWKEVSFNTEELDWELYAGAEDIYNPKVALDPDIVLLSGVEGGSYYQFAKDVQGISEQVKDVRTSYGSVDNLRQLILRTDIFITFLQSDVLVQQQLEDLEDGTNYTENIRILLPLGNEEIHLITRENNKINSLKDLKKKRVAIGTLKQGTYITSSLIKEMVNGKWIDIALPFDSVFAALLNDRIDAFFFVGSAPVSKLQKLPSRTNLKLVPITDDELSEVYVKTTIKANTYPWQKNDVQTFAVKSVLATNINNETNAQQENIKKLLLDIKKNIDDLKKTGHPKWKDVDFDFDAVNWDVYRISEDIFR